MDIANMCVNSIDVTQKTTLVQKGILKVWDMFLKLQLDGVLI